MKSRCRSLAIGAASCLFVAAPAYAGDGSCPWNGLSQSVRTSAMEAGLAGGPAALSASIPAVDLSLAERKCGLKPDNAAALHRAESGYMLQILAEAWLQKHAGLDPRRLDNVWMAMDADARAALQQWVVTLESDPQAVDRAYQGFLKALGGRSGDLPADAKPKIVTYLQGRTFRAVFEPRF